PGGRPFGGLPCAVWDFGSIFWHKLLNLSAIIPAPMIDTIKEHLVEVEKFTATTPEALEAFRIKYLGKKGLLNHFFAEFKNVPNGQKKEYGQYINQLKSAATQKVDALRKVLEDQKGAQGNLNDP